MEVEGVEGRWKIQWGKGIGASGCMEVEFGVGSGAPRGGVGWVLSG